MKVFARLAQPALRLTVEMRTKLLELAAQSTKAEIAAAPTGDRLQVGEGALQKVAPGPGSAPKLSTPYDPLPDGFEALAHLPADELHRCVEDVKVISTALASGAYAQLSLCTTGSLCHEMLLRRKHELLLPETTKKVLETVIRRTNDGGSDDHGPEIELNRMSHVVASQETKRTLFAQACTQLLPRIQGENPDRLRRIRAWKVLFVGEGASHEVIAAHCTAACIRLPLSEHVNLHGLCVGASDAGGPYHESISTMVDELHNDLPSLLIPAPIGRDRMKGLSWSLDYTGDRIYVLNPSHSKPQTLQQLQFFGVFLGVAIRFYISNACLPLISGASDRSQRTLHCTALH
jgi:hypothetical protein